MIGCSPSGAKALFQESQRQRSHGCVRVPLWLANGLRERWGYGSVVRVYG